MADSEWQELRSLQREDSGSWAQGGLCLACAVATGAGGSDSSAPLLPALCLTLNFPGPPQSPAMGPSLVTTEPVGLESGERVSRSSDEVVVFQWPACLAVAFSRVPNLR